MKNSRDSLRLGKVLFRAISIFLVGVSPAFAGGGAVPTPGTNTHTFCGDLNGDFQWDLTSSENSLINACKDQIGRLQQPACLGYYNFPTAHCDLNLNGRCEVSELDAVQNAGVALQIYGNPTLVNQLNCPAVDADLDGYNNWTDNCPNMANPTQLDSNGNGVGDACDGIELMSTRLEEGMSPTEDGVFNPGETVGIYPTIKNLDVNSVATYSYVSFNMSQEDWARYFEPGSYIYFNSTPSLQPLETRELTPASAPLKLRSDIPNNTVIRFQVWLSSNSASGPPIMRQREFSFTVKTVGTYQPQPLTFGLELMSTRLEEGMSPTEDGVFNPGETVGIYPTIKNLDVNSVATYSYVSFNMSQEDWARYFEPGSYIYFNSTPSLQPLETRELTPASAPLKLRSDIPNNTVIRFQVWLSSNSASGPPIMRQREFSFTVKTVGTYQPQPLTFGLELMSTRLVEGTGLTEDGVFNPGETVGIYPTIKNLDVNSVATYSYVSFNMSQEDWARYFEPGSYIYFNSTPSLQPLETRELTPASAPLKLRSDIPNNTVIRFQVWLSSNSASGPPIMRQREFSFTVKTVGTYQPQPLTFGLELMSTRLVEGTGLTEDGVFNPGETVGIYPTIKNLDVNSVATYSYVSFNMSQEDWARYFEPGSYIYFNSTPSLQPLETRELTPASAPLKLRSDIPNNTVIRFQVWLSSNSVSGPPIMRQREFSFTVRRPGS